jgi:hypothetical protein
LTELPEEVSTGSAAAAGAGVRVRTAGCGAGEAAGAAATGVVTWAGCCEGVGAAARAAGVGDEKTGATGAVAGWAATLRPGGSIRRVYERVRRPVDQAKSTITSTNGSWHRTVAGEHEHRGAVVPTAGERESRPDQHRVVVDSGSLEGVGRREAHLQRGGFLGVQARDLDFRAQGLAQHGLHVHAPQAERRSAGGDEGQGRSGQDVQCAPSGDQRAILQFVP